MEFQSLQGQPMSLNANIPSFYAQGCECGVKGLGYQLNVHVLSCVWFFASHGLYPASLLCPWDFPGKNIGVGCHALLQGVFLTQGLNPRLSSPALAGRFFTTSITWEAHLFTLYLTQQAHSGTLAWRIPWMEEPGRLQSMGLPRVGHDWATEHALTQS